MNCWKIEKTLQRISKTYCVQTLLLVEDGKRLERERRKLNESAENREMMKPLVFRPPFILLQATPTHFVIHNHCHFSFDHCIFLQLHPFSCFIQLCSSAVMVRPKMAGTGNSASKKEIKKSESQMMRAGDKRKRKHSRKESYSVYIYRVLKQVCTSNFRP